MANYKWSLLCFYKIMGGFGFQFSIFFISLDYCGVCRILVCFGTVKCMGFPFIYILLAEAEYGFLVAG